MARLDRRTAIQRMMLGTMAASSLPSIASMSTTEFQALKGNIRHAVCRWCYNAIPLEDFCKASAQMGISAIDLVGPKDWPILRKYGLHSSMCNGAEINLTDGWNDTRFHDRLVQNYTEMIPLVAAAGYTNLICFSGNRRGMDNETGWRNCTEGLKKSWPSPKDTRWSSSWNCSTAA